MILVQNAAYGSYHIVCLVVAVLAVVLASIFLRKVSLKNVLTICLLIGVVSETLKVFSYIIANENVLGGYLPRTDLPFHLCSIQILFFIYLRFGKNENLKRILMCFMIPSCLIGGLAAFAIPTNSSLNMPVVTVQYFLYHAMIVWFALYLLITKKIDFTIKDYFNTLIMLFVLAFIAIYLNSWIQTPEYQVNFMYVVRPPANNLPFLTNEYGWLPYFCHYAFTAILVISLFYVKPIVLAIKGLFKKQA